jgi:hypothetical protein
LLQSHPLYAIPLDIPNLVIDTVRNAKSRLEPRPVLLSVEAVEYEGRLGQT